MEENVVNNQIRYKNTPGVNAPVAPAIITTAAAFEPASNFNAMQIASAKAGAQ